MLAPNIRKSLGLQQMSGFLEYFHGLQNALDTGVGARLTERPQSTMSDLPGPCRAHLSPTVHRERR